MGMELSPTFCNDDQKRDYYLIISFSSEFLFICDCFSV